MTNSGELDTFADNETGVNGVSEIALNIMHGEDKSLQSSLRGETNHKLSIPVISFEGVHGSEAKRKEAIEKIKDVSQNWGFFQLANHGIPFNILNDMLDGVRSFHEQDTDSKKKYYSDDNSMNLFKVSVTASRESFSCHMYPNPPEELPEICRDILFEYTEELRKLGATLLELMSEALGLDRNHLRDMGCGKELTIFAHKYPKYSQAEPESEQELNIGLEKHTDSTLVSILLQDHIGGLQVLHQHQWLDVTPIPSTLIVNIGEMMQLITNGRFKSVYHRALAPKEGPRISMAGAFRNMGISGPIRSYGPIKDLLSDQNPPLYREVTYKDFTSVKLKLFKGVNVDPELRVVDHFKI